MTLLQSPREYCFIVVEFSVFRMHTQKITLSNEYSLCLLFSSLNHSFSFCCKFLLMQLLYVNFVRLQERCILAAKLKSVMTASLHFYVSLNRWLSTITSFCWYRITV